MLGDSMILSEPDDTHMTVKRRFERGGFGELISEFSSPRFRSFHADGTLPAV